ncbi:MAG: TonB-dependent receptor plug domain-containing protein, partial [Fimbriimonas ginsengisoli]|nr:TonB-dependent receptor plug domain-containing protein [Fimbriimonas ginsengisoli]
MLETSLFFAGTPAFEPVPWRVLPFESAALPSLVVTMPVGTQVTLRQGERPVKEIVIRVTASRLRPNQAPPTSGSVKRERSELTKFVNTSAGDAKALTKGQKGVAEDSAGQQHVRGEHTDITYVVDGVPLPDTLSGRQGSVVVPSTIESLEILTGGFPPEFGGQTAAVLNISTLPGARHPKGDFSLQGGGFQTVNGELTHEGPVGERTSYVFDLFSTRTAVASEPQAPDVQAAHNAGSSEGAFFKLRSRPSDRDTWTLTLSRGVDGAQAGNRTGLPAQFASSGQGFGFLGLRNADGTRPDVTPDTQSLLGAAPLLMPTQDAAGQDIFQHEVSEFATLSWQRKLASESSLQLALTLLHSGQDVENHNPAVDVMNLPVDGPIDFNPDAHRNVHHAQLVGTLARKVGPHQLKFGFLLDAQSGNEAYRIAPANQLALDALAALDSSLVPAGSASAGLDIDGNPVYTPASGAV